MRKLLAFAACGVLALGVAACGDDDDGNGGGGGGGGGDLSGSIRIDGSSTVGPFAQAAAEEFQGQNPNVRVTVGTSGTGGGFEKFCAGETAISDASRPIEDDEAAVCKKNGIKYQEVQVANDGISVTTNTTLKVDCMTTDQLKEVWNKGSKVTSLSQIDPKFPDTKLSLFGPGTDSGTFDFFTGEINGEEGVSREDYSPSEDDNVLVQGVAGEPGGAATLAAMYQEWPFFRSLVENAEMSLAKADPLVAEPYLRLGEWPDLVAAIREEFRRTRALVLEVTGADRLLGHRRGLRRAGDLRNPYVDALSFLQVRFLAELRAGAADADAGRMADLVLSGKRHGGVGFGSDRHYDPGGAPSDRPKPGG